MSRISFIVDKAHENGTIDDSIAQKCLETRGHHVTNKIWSEKPFSWSGFDIALLRSPWDYYKNKSDFLAWGKSKPPSVKLLNPWPTVEWNLNKRYLDELTKAGVPTVPSYFFKQFSFESFFRALDQIQTEKFVIKPTVSAGSDRTFIFSKKDRDMAAKMANDFFRTEDHMVQPYLVGVESVGELSVILYRHANRSIHFSHACIKLPQAGDFRVQEEFGGSTTAYEPTDDVKNLAEELSKRIPVEWAYARVDLIPGDQGPLVGEIELIEPALYFKTDPGRGLAFVHMLESYL